MARTKHSTPTPTNTDDLLGRILQHAKRTAPASPAAQLEVVFACIDEWHAKKDRVPGDFGDMVTCLLSDLDWDAVSVGSLKQALGTILTNAPSR
jgi:hypothetical protein